MSILFYKRPDYVNKLAGPLDFSSCQKYVERAACSSSSIPDNLSFANVVEGRTLPVYTPRCSKFVVPTDHPSFHSHAPYKISWTTYATLLAMQRIYSFISGCLTTSSGSMHSLCQRDVCRRNGKPTSLSVRLKTQLEET